MIGGKAVFTAKEILKEKEEEKEEEK